MLNFHSEAKCSALGSKYGVISDTVQVSKDMRDRCTHTQGPHSIFSPSKNCFLFSLHCTMVSLSLSLPLTHCLSRCLPKNLHSKRRDNQRLLKHGRKTFKWREGGVVVVVVEAGIGGGGVKWRCVGGWIGFALLRHTVKSALYSHTNTHVHTYTHKDSLIDSRLDTQFRGETIPLYPSLHQIFKHLY